MFALLTRISCPLFGGLAGDAVVPQGCPSSARVFGSGCLSSTILSTSSQLVPYAMATCTPEAMVLGLVVWLASLGFGRVLGFHH